MGRVNGLGTVVGWEAAGMGEVRGDVLRGEGGGRNCPVSKVARMRLVGEGILPPTETLWRVMPSPPREMRSMIS